ncbi:MAG: bifunctional 5,10-methylenetetrahydrofolate dehydrogenase/5,10-methenyltetrahydrofolate cyclohydrolase [bacterium]|nr:bifunctional 5,10-methylenetetrahydrofolate dehydrogenase/5,10-methenyltetrahydrofolate cyclohydrolase [bacterium]
MGQLIDGKAIAAEIRARLREDIARSGHQPGLAIVLVGDDPASHLYVQRKRHACAEIGMRAEVVARPAGIRAADLIADIQQLNARPDIDGIIVQRPLPPLLSAPDITAAIAPEKDVDGLHPENVGLLLLGKPRFIPATPKGIRELLLRSGHDPAGQHVVIIGRGPLVGKPLAALLLQRHRGGNATVSICHTGTRDLAAITRTADILVSAIGRPRFVTADMVRPGAVVIDVGINRIPDAETASGTRIVGDVDFDAVRAIAGAITPVPGGVGPMTVAMLLENTVEAAQKRPLGSS